MRKGFQEAKHKAQHAGLSPGSLASLAPVLPLSRYKRGYFSLFHIISYTAEKSRAQLHLPGETAVPVLSVQIFGLSHFWSKK